MSQIKGDWLWSVNVISLLLYPLSVVFCGLTKIRSYLYKIQFYDSAKPPCPVIVVGNLSVGGNGKTPVVMNLVNLLKQNGFTPGVITRGYKSQAEASVTVLDLAQQNDVVGDEANMLSEICACPIAVGIDRPVAAQTLFDEKAVDVIISDDGLQHYALQRDIEVVIKRKIAMGNAWCLPAGPLREPLSRLSTSDIIIDRDSADVVEEISQAWSLDEPKNIKPLAEFKGQKVHAIAGIGFPQAFFSALKQIGLTIIEHHYADHYDFVAFDLQFDDNLPILMTHKDAVKVRAFGIPNCWVVPLQLALSNDIQQQLLNKLASLNASKMN